MSEDERGREYREQGRRSCSRGNDSEIQLNSINRSAAIG